MSEVKSVTYIRAIAQLMIIGAHIQFVVPWLDRVDLIKTVRPLFENATFPFFILSGLLLSLVNNHTPYKVFLGKKLKSVIFPYLIAVIPLFIIYTFYPDFLLTTNKIYSMRNTTAIVALTSGKNSVNIAMWFFPVICTFFLISPFFRSLHERPKLLIAFVVSAFFLSNFTHRPPSTEEFLRSFQYFLFPYSLGVLMGRYYDKSKELLKQFVWIFLCLFILVYYLQIQYGPIGGLDRLTFDQMSLVRPDLSLLQKLFLTLFLMGAFAIYNLPSWLDKSLDQISKYAFGLHLYHGYFLTFYILAFGKWGPGYGVGMFFLQFTLVVSVCFAFCKLVAKVSPRTGRLVFSA